jgi:hypothetical protein
MEWRVPHLSLSGVDVGAGRGEHAHDVGTLMLRGEVERSPAAIVPVIDVVTSGQQRLHLIDRSVDTGVVQRNPPSTISLAW